MDKLNDLFTFKLFNVAKNKSSFSKPLLLFYASVGLTLISDLYSGQLMDFIKTNRYARHIVGFIIMFLFLLDSVKIDDSMTLVLYSFILYFMFIMATKMDLHWSLGMVVLLIIGYIYEKRIHKKEQEIIRDKTLKEEDINSINKYHDKMRGAITISIITIIILGTLNYVFKKKTQYGGNFDIDKFIFSGGKKNMKYL